MRGKSVLWCEKGKYTLLGIVLFLAMCLWIMPQQIFAATNEYKFDFGAGGTANGYIGVSAQDGYNAARGYGFNMPGSMVNVGAAGRGALSDAVQFKSTDTRNTFNVNLDNGLYEVTVYLGNTMRTSIWAEGCLQIMNMTGNNAVHTIKIPVTDGQLNIMATAGKAGYAFTMSALHIKKISDKLAMPPTIWICGDSTVCNYYPLATSAQAGWGQMLPEFIDMNVWQVRNMAASGQWAKGFVNAGQFEPILKYGRQGDIYFISIGINDTNYSNETEYYETVKYMAQAAKQKGMKVILVKQQGRSTDISRNPLLTGRWFNGTLDRIGNEVDVQVIDLFNLAQDYFLSIGQDATNALYMPNDTLHPNRQGAKILAKLVAEQVDFSRKENNVNKDVYYAIDANYYNAFYEISNAGYTGEAYINLYNEVGSYIEWEVNAPDKGNYLVTFRIANASPNDRMMKIEVNNGADYWLQSFTSTGSWTTWQERGIVLPLEAGKNKIKATSYTNEGGPNIDYIKLELTDEPVAETHGQLISGGNTTPGSEGVTVYIAGDSTAQSYRESYAPQQGWGYYLQNHLGNNITVANHAIAGRSSKSFYDNGRLDTILNEIKQNDYLMIQFGINDAAYNKEERYAPVCGSVTNPQVGSFEFYIKKYVEGALAHGAKPVLISPTLGLKSYSNGRFVNSYTNYAQAMQSIASYYKITYIDLNSQMVELYNRIGYDAAKLYHLCGVVPGSTDMTHFSEAGADKVAELVAASFIKAFGMSSGNQPVVPTPDTNIDTNAVYMLKNANSGLYLEVANGTAANAANVQQWGASGAAAYNTWKFVSVGNGYYQIYSCVGDGSYLLDVDGNRAANGTNIQIYQNTNCDAQVFKVNDNGDGTYTLYTKTSNNKSCVEVKNAITTSGGNVQEWELNNHPCQKWILEKVTAQSKPEESKPEEVKPEESQPVTKSDIIVSMTTTNAGNNIAQTYKIKSTATDVALNKLKLIYKAQNFPTQKQNLTCNRGALQLNVNPWYVDFTGAVKGQMINGGFEITTDSLESLPASSGEGIIEVYLAKEDWSKYDDLLGETLEVYYDGVRIQ